MQKPPSIRIQSQERQFDLSPMSRGTTPGQHASLQVPNASRIKTKLNCVEMREHLGLSGLLEMKPAEGISQRTGADSCLDLH